MSGSIVDLMQPEFVQTEIDECELRFRPRPEFTIGGGVVQGGIVATMLDLAMAVAASGAIATASLHVDILRPVVGEVLTVKGRITRRGRRVVFAEAELSGPDGTLLARGVQTAVPAG